uniref:Uncharacterized protein n=1 Tax=Leersia perrieri TaxID=77586 RepID=A0A0D9XUY2_9ORYZ
MEKKCESLARITTVLKDVIQNKDRIIAWLQQPYSLDCIPVEAEYQKQLSELLLKAPSDYGALTASVEDNSYIVRRLGNFGCRHAMVGCEFLDHDAMGESHIGISVADATDYTKSESDLVLTRPALTPVSSAVQIREICQMMKGYMVSLF